MNGMGDWTVSNSDGFKPYHDGPAMTATERSRVYRGQNRESNLREKEVIVWDGEGIKLSGSNSPQHYVLFGCSADIHNPLITATAKDTLDFFELADYMLMISARHPGAVHAGYFFEYDQNMIIRSLHWAIKERLYETGKAIVKRGETRYFLKLVLGKKITITRVREDGSKVTIKIDDIGSFFASSFVKAYVSLFPDAWEDSAFHRVVEGKAVRADTKWEDMPSVLEYWTEEMKALHRLTVRFRDVMFDAGFMLTEWYGPGALANYIRRTNNLVKHEWGAKEENLFPGIHNAAKSAMFGGHVELFTTGRIKGPIYVYDINSAYPFAFTNLPSLAQGGFWQWVDGFDVSRKRQPMGVYHIVWRNTDSSMFEHRSQPFPHRDRDGNISFPTLTDGWYWTPEVYTVLRRAGMAKHAQVLGGYEWIPANDEQPWSELIHSMYEKRLTLKKAKNPVQMAYKLGPNSLYGKMAQRTGWNKETNKPPSAHSLSIAGYITSFCRAQIMSVTSMIRPDELYAIETDGLFTSRPPQTLPVQLGDKLGEWSVTEYDEILFVQNGLYLARQGDVWHPKTRGIAKLSTPEEANEFAGMLINHFSGLDNESEWEPLTLPTGERFLGLGSAISRSRNERKQVNPFKASALHCRWVPNDRVIDMGGKGKRRHVKIACPACRQGFNAAETNHRLVIRSRALDNPVSAPYRLPWEGTEAFQWQEHDELVQQPLG